MVTTPSLRVYPFYICPAAQLGLVSYQNHIKSIYGPYMGQGSPTLQKLDFGLCARVFSAVLTHIEPTIVFHTRQRFPIRNHVTSGSMSLPSYFHTAQRFSFPKHVTSGSMSPPSLFPTSQRFPSPLPVMTSLDQSEARITPQTGALYYSFTVSRFVFSGF